MTTDRRVNQCIYKLMQWCDPAEKQEGFENLTICVPKGDVKGGMAYINFRTCKDAAAVLLGVPDMATQKIAYRTFVACSKKLCLRPRALDKWYSLLCMW